VDGVRPVHSETACPHALAGARGTGALAGTCRVDVVEVLACTATGRALLSRQELRAAGVSDAALAGRSRGRSCGCAGGVRLAAARPPVWSRDEGVEPTSSGGPCALLELGPGAVAAGRTAAVLRGWGLLHEPRRAVEVVVPHGSDRSPLGIRVRQVRRPEAEEVVPLHGPRSAAGHDCRADPSSTARWPCRTSTRLSSRDSALRAGAATVEELQEATARLPGVRGGGTSPARRRGLRPGVRVGARVRAARAHGARPASTASPTQVVLRTTAGAARRLLLRLAAQARRRGSPAPVATRPARDQSPRQRAPRSAGGPAFTWQKVVTRRASGGDRQSSPSRQAA
jgi:hypothetical protein